MCNRNWPIFLKIYNLSCVTTANNALNIFLLCVLMYVKTALQLEIVKIHTRYLDVSNKQPLISYINHYCIRGSFTVGRDLHTVYIHRDIIALREWERLNYNCHIKKIHDRSDQVQWSLNIYYKHRFIEIIGRIGQ